MLKYHVTAKTLTAWLLLASSCFAQVELRSSAYYVIEGLGKVQQVGDLTLVQSVPQITVKPVGVIRVDTEAANIEVSVSDESRVPYTPKQIDKNLWLIDNPGKWWVDVTAIDFQKNIYGRKQAVVEVGEAPEPGPGPGPTPPPPNPNGPFDGLAAKIRAHAAHLPQDHRTKIAFVCASAAEQMKTFGFKQVDQARAYIKANWPPCVNAHCSAIWSLVVDDSSARNLGWQEIQAYYLEVAKGVQ